MLIPLVLSSCSSWTVERYIYEYNREKYETEDYLSTGFASYDSVYYDHEKTFLLILKTNTMTVKVKYGYGWI